MVYLISNLLLHLDGFQWLSTNPKVTIHCWSLRSEVKRWLEWPGYTRECRSLSHAKTHSWFNLDSATAGPNFYIGKAADNTFQGEKPKIYYFSEFYNWSITGLVGCLITSFTPFGCSGKPLRNTSAVQMEFCQIAFQSPPPKANGRFVGTIFAVLTLGIDILTMTMVKLCS